MIAAAVWIYQIHDAIKSGGPSIDHFGSDHKLEILLLPAFVRTGGEPLEVLRISQKLPAASVTKPERPAVFTNILRVVRRDILAHFGSIVFQ
jgi:hypothetical protein